MIQLLFVLSQILGAVSAVMLIWLTVLAFKRSLGWGIALALFSPLATVFFGIRFWNEVRKPFVLFLGSFVPALVFGLVAFSAIGGWKAVAEARRIHSGIQDGTLTEEDALRFMRANLDVIENTGVSEEDQRKLDFQRKFLAQFEAGMTDEAAEALGEELQELVGEEGAEVAELSPEGGSSEMAALETGAAPRDAPPETVPAAIDTEAEAAPAAPLAPEAEPAPATAEPPPPQEPQLETEASTGLDLEAARAWIGRPVLVTRRGQRERVVLAEVRETAVVVQRRVSLGTLSVEYAAEEIDALEPVDLEGGAP